MILIQVPNIFTVTASRAEMRLFGLLTTWLFFVKNVHQSLKAVNRKQFYGKVLPKTSHKDFSVDALHVISLSTQ